MMMAVIINNKILKENLKKIEEKMAKQKNTYTEKYKEPSVPVLEISKEERESKIKLMRRIFEIQSASGEMTDMQSFIVDFVTELNDDTIDASFDAKGNIYVTKGRADTYPCIVSHMDTVHRIIPKNDYKVLRSDTDFFAMNVYDKTRTGVGGDDNNGIFCCLDNLIREPKIKLAFFVDEEIGCVGSRACNMDFFEDVSFVLQADRKGYGDVTNNIMGIEMFSFDFFGKITDVLDSYSRDLAEGGMTDVMQLAENGLEVCMANFSCGYYLPHSCHEYVVIDELILTSILFRDIIKVAYVDGERNEMKRDLNYQSGYGDYGYYDDLDWDATTRVILDKKKAHNSLVDIDEEEEKSRRALEHNSCTVCADHLIYDVTIDHFYCFTCQDYDYEY